MSELLAICEAARSARATGTTLFMASVVHVEGSSYRRPGARMLFTSERLLAGSISGGCLERDVLARGPYRTREQAAVVARYDSSSEGELGVRVGLGCGGVVDVLIERIDPTSMCSAINFFERSVAAEQSGVLVTVHRSLLPEVPVGARLALSAQERSASFLHARVERELSGLAERALERQQSSCYRAPDGTLEAFVEFVRPPPHLFVCGSNHDVVPLLTLATNLGWRVTSVDRQERFSTRETLSRVARRLILPSAQLREHVDGCARPLVVIMSHDQDYDRELLGQLLGSRALYVGVLGPRRRTERMLSELASSGRAPSELELARMYAPAGLALGAEGPEEIALSIAAELQAVVARAAAVSLRETYPSSFSERCAYAESAE